MADEVKLAKFKLTDKEKNLFNSLYGTYDKLDKEERDARTAELKQIIANARQFRQGGVRDAYITKALHKSKYFNDYNSLKDLNPDFPIDPDYFKLISDKDIKTKNVGALENYNEGLFNWESNEHWHKLPKKVLQDYANTMGLSEDELLKDLQKFQQQKDVQDMFSFKNDPHAWLAAQLYPRTAEAVMRGEDPTIKDVGLDAGENLLYTVNPFGKAMGVGAKFDAGVARNVLRTNPAKAGRIANEAKALNLLGKTADVAGNPVAMEIADAIAYDDENNDRSHASVMDMLYGTGMNAMLGRAVPGMIRGATKEVAPVTVVTNEAKEAAKQRAAMGSKSQIDVKKSQILREKQAAKELEQEGEKAFKDRLKEESKKKSDLTKASKATRNATAAELIGMEFNPNKMWAVDFTTNKVGDFLGENPKMRNRAVRSLPGGRFIYPFLEEQETEQQKADREAREQVYDLLGR